MFGLPAISGLSGRKSSHRLLRSNPPQRDLLDRMAHALAQDQVGAGAGGQDVLAEIDEIDPVPQPLGDGDRFLLLDGRVAVEVRSRIAEGGFAEPLETLDVPAADDGLV